MATANSQAFRREPGDWTCTQCNEVNFKSRTACRRCSTARNQPAQTNPTTTSGTLPPQAPRPGDWNCRSCNAINFASRNACFKCGKQKQELISSNTLGLRPGDWVCQWCKNDNFAARIACHKCGRPKPVSMAVDTPPQATVKPGDWKCSFCPEINFGSRIVCRSCGKARPSADNNSTGTKSECVICMDKSIDSVITTCGHSAVCLSCGTTINECPMCRNPFTQQQIIKLFHAH